MMDRTTVDGRPAFRAWSEYCGIGHLRSMGKTWGHADSIHSGEESSSTSGVHSSRDHHAEPLSEVGEGGGVGFEGRNGFDQAGDGESVADPAVAAYEMQRAAFAGELDGDANQRGDAGAVDLGHAVEVDDDLAAAALNHGLQRFVELLAGFSDGQTAADFQQMNAVRLADGNLHGDMVGHSMISFIKRSRHFVRRKSLARTKLSKGFAKYLQDNDCACRTRPPRAARRRRS